MSRSNYSDDGDNDNWDIIRWRGAVTSAIRGKRGQQLLRELADAMDAMPVKELIADDLIADGRYCALGVVGAKRGIALTDIDPEDTEQVCRAFDISDALAREIMYVNDNRWITRAGRWALVRAWVDEHITNGGSRG